ncbi:PREDICTED: uncharacterized protein LOC109227679 [Nicotiana attenuata]|uniref:uncharacterized protein LOC109227679 n=1 Tax=Nicotiana attenuata TaxID=49451 RepID=UPI000904E116|nr:PREDICTED: uncharacterized protein LOC109227679 [Nicotiana attenuata]
MQTYWAQIFILPKKVVQLITSVCRTFLWTGSCEASRKALVSWESLCMPRSAGGLKLIDYTLWNRAAICKLIWAVSTRKESLWVQWIHGYYVKNKEIEFMKTPTQACWLVRKILDARKWFGNRNYKVELEKCSKGDKFSIKAAYLSFQPQYPKNQWKNLTMEARQISRHQFILWLAIKQRLATVDRLERWEIHVPKECVLCSTGTTETLAHLFFECKYARDIWCSLLKWMNENRAPKTWSEEVSWMTKRCKGSKAKSQVLAWLFVATVYHVWIERNARRFQNEKRESHQRLKEISLQLHIRGQCYSK